MSLRKKTSCAAAILAFLIGACFYPLLASGNELFPADQVEEFRLDNGMLFLLMPHGETPIFSAYIRLKVGGMDEPRGMTGVAHVIEHMAFKGTRRWGSRDWEKERKVLSKIEIVGQKLAAEYAKAKQANPETIKKLQSEMDELYREHQQWTIREELTREYQKRGGLRMNATTSQDLTSYFIALPSSELDFWMKTEAERIFEPVFREFYRERDVVLEERRSRVVDDPGGAFYTAILAASFTESPYGRPTIGYEEDILTLTRTKAENFFKSHYHPDKAVGVIVGRFDKEKVKKGLQETFGRIPANPEKVVEPFKRPPNPPYQRAACRVDVTRPAQPRFAVMFHKPTLPSKEDYVFDLLSGILTQDRAARLYRSLVIEKALAASVSAYAGIPGSRLPNAFMIFATPRPGVPLDRLAEEIDAELKRLQDELIPADEIERTRKQLLNAQVWRLESNDSLASELSYFQAVADDWRYVVNYPKHLKAVTAEDIRNTAKKYFTPGNRCYGFLHPGKGEAP